MDDDAAKTREELIAELDQMRARLGSVETHYQALLAAHADAVLMFDLESTFGIEQSPRARTLFGYTDEEFHQIKAQSLAPPGQRAEMAMISAQLQAMGRARRPRMRLRRKDGSEFWGDVSVSVFESDGQKRVMNVVRDITAMLEHEERVRQQKELLQTVFDHIPVMAVLFDDSGRARFVNREAELVLGWTLEEWQAGNVLAACFPDADVFAQASELLAKTPSRWIELAARTRFGRAIETIWYGVALPSGGALAIAQDVTAQKTAAREVRLLEDRLRRKQKLESLGTLAAGVAHEVNNPLTWLMGNVECLKVLLDDHGENLPARVIEDLSEIAIEMRDGTERIRRIVAGLKPFTRSDEDSFGPVDLLSVLDAAVDLAGNEIRHRARLVRRIRKVPPVYGNPARLTQVFVNLLVNAAQAIAHGHAADNRIRIATRMADDTRVCVTVADTGVGIPAPVLDRIFEPFFTTRAPERTGLGLSICHSIVESCGGEIEVVSQPGEGTCFNIYLPASAEPLPRPAAPMLSGPAQPARVLVIDDEPNVCQLIRRALRGHDVTVASSGHEALERLDEDDYDVILCDVMMPDLSGIDVYNAVCETRPDYAERVVFMTGGAFSDKARSFLARTERRILQKPVDLAQLRAVVAEVAAATADASELSTIEMEPTSMLSEARPHTLELATTEPVPSDS
jgi:two-component system cell cycle sensor histidine kinase/response regulator CckA